MSVVVQTSLEMCDPAWLRPARPPRVPARLDPVDPVDWEVNRRLYAGVGDAYGWTDRLVWPQETWVRWCDRVETWRLLAGDDGQEAGFFELGCQARRTVEIMIFGLLAPWHGAGLGGWMLTEALRRAWELHPDGTRRVWVHTRTLDAEGALPNYRARGLRVFDRLLEP